MMLSCENCAYFDNELVKSKCADCIQGEKKGKNWFPETDQFIFSWNNVSCDERRNLYEFGDGGKWRSLKIIEAKELCTVGNHYHKEKDELFILLKGKILEMTVGEEKIENIESKVEIFVKKRLFHRFTLEEGSLLLCLSSKKFNEWDEIKR